MGNGREGGGGGFFSPGQLEARAAFFSLLRAARRGPLWAPRPAV